MTCDTSPSNQRFKSWSKNDRGTKIKKNDNDSSKYANLI